MALGESLEFTPSWAVATVTAVLVSLSLLLEYSLHLISAFVIRAKRKSLNQAVYQLKSVLRNLGFITLLLTIANHPMGKVCISTSSANTLLACLDGTTPDSENVDEEDSGNSCSAGKVPLLSQDGIRQLQTLILMLALSHVACSLLTLCLGQFKMRKWAFWEQETNTLDHRLSVDNRRFRLVMETSFGRRHLKFQSRSSLLLWAVCIGRQFTCSVSKADYLALRNGFINAHIGMDTDFNFHKFLRRCLDEDFKLLVTISLPIWTYVVLFIFFGAHAFYAHFWLPFIPIVLLLAIGAKLEAIISQMCLKGSSQTVVILGKVTVHPNDKLFWFGRPRWLLYAVQFILIENSFQLAYILWDLYTFGYHSCLHRETEDFALFLGSSVLVQIVCAYITLPLYALVSQMGSSMKETIFSEQVVAGLKHWLNMAKKNVSTKESISTPSSSPSATPSMNSVSTSPSSIHGSFPSLSSRWSKNRARASSSLEGSSSYVFEFPKLRRELVEFQRVTEEMMINQLETILWGRFPSEVGGNKIWLILEVAMVVELDGIVAFAQNLYELVEAMAQLF